MEQVHSGSAHHPSWAEEMDIHHLPPSRRSCQACCSGPQWPEWCKLHIQYIYSWIASISPVLRCLHNVPELGNSFRMRKLSEAETRKKESAGLIPGRNESEGIHSGPRCPCLHRGVTTFKPCFHLQKPGNDTHPENPSKPASSGRATMGCSIFVCPSLTHMSVWSCCTMLWFLHTDDITDLPQMAKAHQDVFSEVTLNWALPSLSPSSLECGGIGREETNGDWK